MHTALKPYDYFFHFFFISSFHLSRVFDILFSQRPMPFLLPDFSFQWFHPVNWLNETANYLFSLSDFVMLLFETFILVFHYFLIMKVLLLWNSSSDSWDLEASICCLSFQGLLWCQYHLKSRYYTIDCQGYFVILSQLNWEDQVHLHLGFD